MLVPYTHVGEHVVIGVDFRVVTRIEFCVVIATEVFKESIPLGETTVGPQ